MKYRTIDTAGQLTAVITNQIQLSDLSQIARSIMENDPRIEQVGYLLGNQFIMMGGELSINGLVAGAYLIGSSGKINEFSFTLNNKIITLNLPKSLVLKVDGNIVYLRGITYKTIPYLPTNNAISPSTKNELIELAKGSSAAGLIYYQNGTINPLIYVPQTDTYVWEKACGSGSLAYALVTGQQKAVQPSGRTILINSTDKTITVTETVKEI